MKISNREIKKLEEDGLVVIKNFLSSNEIKEVRSEIANLLSCLLKKKIGINSLEKSISYNCKKIKKLQMVLYDRSQNLFSLYKLIISKKIKYLSRSILKTENFGIWPRPQIRIDNKNDKINHIKWHHDYLYNKGSSHSFTFWIPIINIDKSNGPLLFAKGSHKKNFDKKFFKERNFKRFKYNIKKKELNNLDIFALDDIKKGDLVLFHCKTLHSGQLNTSDKSRITILFRVQNLKLLES